MWKERCSKMENCHLNLIQIFMNYSGNSTHFFSKFTAHRHVGETNMNTYSSRSHTIFRMVCTLCMSSCLSFKLSFLETNHELFELDYWEQADNWWLWSRTPMWCSSCLCLGIYPFHAFHYILIMNFPSENQFHCFPILRSFFGKVWLV